MSNVEIEFLKSGLSLTVAVLSLGLGWLVTSRITYRWNLRQKSRESDLAAAAEFHGLYGEFFAVWKLWAYALKNGGAEEKSGLLQRACAAEGKVEALLVRLAATRDLRPEDVKAFGCFRQAYQTLRESIRDGHPIDWYQSGHPEYLAFKRFATYLSLAISTGASPNDEMVKKRVGALISITSNEWENIWASDRVVQQHAAADVSASAASPLRQSRG